MGVCLSHITALEFYRAHADLNPKTLRRVSWNPRTESSARFIPSVDQIHHLDFEHLGLKTRPLHLMAPNSQARSKSKLAACHLFSAPLEKGLVIQIEPELYIVSPELLIGQTGVESGRIAMIELAFEFCGSYRLGSNNIHFAQARERGFSDAIPIASNQCLQDLAIGPDRFPAKRPLSRVLKYIAGSSASPMETSLTMLLCLPRRLGGYGLPLPRLNCEIDPDCNSLPGISQAHFFCDLYWPQSRLAVEYDSNAFHSGHQQISNDATRRNSLHHLGVDVITITYGQILSTKALERAVRQITRKLDVRFRDFNEEWWIKHLELRKAILPAAFKTEIKTESYRF